MCLCYLFSAKNCMTTSESKGHFLRNESIRIDSHNELECSGIYVPIVGLMPLLVACHCTRFIVNLLFCYVLGK